jgi:hypothetical protein
MWSSCARWGATVTASTHRTENIVELRVIAIAANDDPMIDR